MARKKRNQFDVDEIYRGLRTNIEFSQMDDAIQVINVVSTIPNEGKSTIACNLARIMAAKYKNVLLIDCDLRNASVHKTLQISNRSGLTNIISEFREGVSIHLKEYKTYNMMEVILYLSLLQVIEYQILVKY